MRFDPLPCAVFFVRLVRFVLNSWNLMRATRFMVSYVHQTAAPGWPRVVDFVHPTRRVHL